jgi:hypothetical protein
LGLSVVIEANLQVVSTTNEAHHLRIMNKLRPIRTEADYENPLAEVERLWGSKSGTRKGNRLDVLATLIRAPGRKKAA